MKIVPFPRREQQSAASLKGETVAFSPDQIKADLKYLYQTLQEAHYNLYVHTRRDELEKEYKRIKASLHAPLTLHEVNLRFQRFVALVNVGHCNIAFYYGRYGSDGNRLFAFDLIVRDGRVLISRSYSTDSRFVAGDQLLALEGKPINAAMDEVLGYLCGERRYLKESSMEGISFPRLWWYAHGNRDSYHVQVRNIRGNILSAQVDTVKARTFDQERGVNIPCRSDREFKIIHKHIAYLYPGPFLNVAGGKTYDNAAFLRFLESAFTDISTHKITNLIVDLRNNPGGDNSFSDPMIAYFATRPFRFCSKYSLRTSRVLKEYWTNEVPKSLEQPTPEIERMKQAILAHKVGERFEYAISDYEPRRDALRFRGKVYALINRHSYSNATCTAAIIQDYRFGELIGEETADVPTSYASSASFALPNTGIKVTYPKGYFIRPSGDTKLKGVIPHHRVVENPFTPEDEVLAFAIRRIKVHTK
jgi:hypothetical protein